MSCGKLNSELNFDLRIQQIEQSMAYNLSSIVILTSTKENWLELSLERETNYSAPILHIECMSSFQYCEPRYFGIMSVYVLALHRE